MFLIILLQILSSFAFIFCKSLAYLNSPFFVAGFRMIIAGIIILTFSYFTEKESIFPLIRKQWKMIFIASFINTYLTNSFGQYGINHLSPAIVSFIYNLTPFITAFLSTLFLSERISLQKWIGLFIGFIGFLPMLIQSASGRLHASINLLPQIIIILSAMSGAYGWILIKQIIQHTNINILLVNGITLFIGGILSLIHSFFIETWPSLHNSNLWTYSLSIALITHVFWYNLYSLSLKQYSATFMSFTNFITTIFTGILSFLVFKEKFSLTFGVSIFVVILGLYIFYKDEKKNSFNICDLE